MAGCPIGRRLFYAVRWLADFNMMLQTDSAPKNLDALCFRGNHPERNDGLVVPLRADQIGRDKSRDDTRRQ
jgi:hypothetical protein